MTNASLFTVGIIGPLFDDLLGGPAAPVVPALLGGAIAFGLVLLRIDIFCFSISFRRFLLFRPRLLVPPEMVTLAARVPALPLGPVPVIMPPPLAGALLVLLPALLIRLPRPRGLRNRCIRAVLCLLGLI